MRVTFIGFAALTVFLLYGAETFAKEINGSNDPTYRAALSDWLVGEDTAALTSFAELARKENRSAQIFLGQLESKLWLHQHITNNLTRKEKIALLRNPKGLSGKSWLQSASVDTNLAQLFITARKPFKGQTVGMELLSLGELSTALPLIYRAQRADDPLGALELSLHANAVPYTAGFVQPAIFDLPFLATEIKLFSLDDPRLGEIQSRLHLVSDPSGVGHIMWNQPGPFGLWGAVYWGAETPRAPDLVDQPSQLSEIGLKLLAVPELRTIITVIERSCPGEIPEVLAALQMTRMDEPLTFLTFSPVESLLSTEDYRSSDRFETDVLRKLGFNLTEEQVLRDLSGCAHRMVFQRDN